MNRLGTNLVSMVSGLILGLSAVPAVASTADSPYHRIPTRNVFGLREPPAVKGPERVPPPKITLTGITTILARKVALLKWPDAPKPGQRPGEQSFMLTEGQREGDVVVLQIDERAGTVKVNNHGVVQTVGFAA